jgi:D-alanine-D-alanine ligase
MLNMKAEMTFSEKASVPASGPFTGGWPQPPHRLSPTLPGYRTTPAARPLPDLERRLRALMPSVRVAVIHGGDKEQPGSVLYRTVNTRPWKSYREVAEDLARALRELGFVQVDVLAEDMNLPGELQRRDIGLAWLNTGGVQGDNPVCHGSALLEMLGIPYVGHSPLHAALLDEKDVFKRMLRSAGLPTAAFLTWQPDCDESLADRLQQVFEQHSGPFVVKPVSGRASLHVTRVENAQEAQARAAEVFAATRRPVLIERFLAGREFCVAVGGPVVCRSGQLYHQGGPFAFSTLERKLEPGEDIFTSMDRKAITGDRATLVPAGGLRDRLEDLARKIYREFDLRSLVRIDIRADEKGRLHVLEANPKPDLKRPGVGVTSLVALGLPGEQMSYHDLILGLLADRLHDLAAHNPARLAHLAALS